jgi:hypothetical protein
MEGSVHGVIQVYVPEFAWRGLRKTANNSEYAVSGPRLEVRTSEITSRSYTHSVALFGSVVCVCVA